MKALLACFATMLISLYYLILSGIRGQAGWSVAFFLMMAASIVLVFVIVNTMPNNEWTRDKEDE